jgi:proton-translocating NADH-quinone oxidoreductase chain N
MINFLALNCEIYILVHVLKILIIGVIIQSKLLDLKYKIFIYKVIINFSCLILFFSLIITSKSLFFEALLLNYQITQDYFTFFFKFMILLTSFICIIFSSDYCEYENIKGFEHVILLLFSILGLLTIISCYDLITMYLGIELQSLCFYIITNIKFYSDFSIEAGLKYFILGALSSGILLFGSSLLYGATGMTNFLDLSILFYSTNLQDYNYYQYYVTLLGLFLIYSGILFKIGIVPFHMWVSDIYQGAPTNISFFFAIVPQISIVSLLLRLNNIFIYAFLKQLFWFFMVLALLSIIIGTLGAIYQIKVKRILAFSSINNMGYMLTMILTMNVESIYGIIFYMIVYNLTSIGLWLLFVSFRDISNITPIEDITDLMLLFKSNKFLSIIFFIFLFSNMGIPPMLGFFGKLFVILNLLKLQMYVFAIFLIIFNSLAVMYYLRLLKIMYSTIPDKWIFLNDIGEWKSYFLIILVYFNIFFVFYPNYFLLLIHNIIILIFS